LGAFGAATAGAGCALRGWPAFFGFFAFAAFFACPGG
jgi:hypothetical protein